MTPAGWRSLASGLLVTTAVAIAVPWVSAPQTEKIVAGYATSLAGRGRGQRHNAAQALEKLDGTIIEPGKTFSFNGRVGTWSRDEGYRKAPVSYGGQLIEAWGGGVCQASTTLYNAALLSGMQIVERHRHQFAPSYITPGRDAAVAYSNIDLKLRNPFAFPLRIHARIEGELVRIDVLAKRSPVDLPQIVQEVRKVVTPTTFATGPANGAARLRNGGKPGYEVATYRDWRDRRELLSIDSYPVMHRLLEFRDQTIP